MNPRNGHRPMLVVRSPISFLHLSKINQLIDSDPLAVGSTAGVMVEREPLKRGEDIRGFREKDVGESKGKGAGGPRENPEVCCDDHLFLTPF